MGNNLKSMLHRYFLVVASAQLAACAGPILKIESTTPARIEADGTPACDSTPCEIGGRHYVDDFGACTGGADTRLEAFPIDPNAGYKQSKLVFGGCNAVVPVFFDMNSGGVVNTIQSSSEPKGSASQLLSEKLSILQDLKEKNLISDEEYKLKRMELLDSLN